MSALKNRFVRCFCCADRKDIRSRALKGQSPTPSSAVIRGIIALSLALPGHLERPISVANTILVIDDDPLVRRISALVLQSAGFLVIVAEDGDQGLELFAQHRGAIALVITDLTMPRMHGSEVYVALRGQDPRLPIVLSSGLSVEKGALDDLASDAYASFLAKPYLANQLVGAVRLALGSA